MNSVFSVANLEIRDTSYFFLRYMKVCTTEVTEREGLKGYLFSNLLRGEPNFYSFRYLNLISIFQVPLTFNDQIFSKFKTALNPDSVRGDDPNLNLF